MKTETSVGDRAVEMTPQKSDRWKMRVLRLASVHCILWGIFVILFPVRSEAVYGFSGPLEDSFLWQGTGLIIALMGAGYGLASTDPSRHYSVVLVGLLAKVLGPVGLAWCVWNQEIPATVLILIPINDIIWWYPFYRIVRDGAGTRSVCNPSY